MFSRHVRPRNDDLTFVAKGASEWGMLAHAFGAFRWRRSSLWSALTQHRRHLTIVLCAATALIDPVCSYAASISVDELGGKTMNAEWLRHRKWYRNDEYKEDDFYTRIRVIIQNDGSFSGNFEQSVDTWSQKASFYGNVHEKNIHSMLPFIETDTTFLYENNTASIVWSFGKGIQKIDFVLSRNRGGWSCQLRDKFLTIGGAPIEWTYNGALERHVSDKVTSSKCDVTVN